MPESRRGRAGGCSGPRPRRSRRDPTGGRPASLPPAADAPASPTLSIGTLSASAAGPRLAPWQERLTLGAGDVVQLGIYGRGDLSRTDVAVGPDGRLSYLEATDIRAAGLTIDELRARLEEDLSRTRRNVRVTVRPSAWRSKKYYLLGTVMDRGAYSLDRPITLIEAVARARGIATGLLEQNTVEIADLPRAFLVRANRRIPVDFVKPRRGVFAQNVLLEPGDYVSTSSPPPPTRSTSSAPSPARAPSASPRTPRWSGASPRAVASPPRLPPPRPSDPRFPQPTPTHRRRRRRHPRRQSPRRPVQPRDIIYVSERPWIDAEELLDTAIKAFIQGAAAAWAGLYVPPAFTEPVIPGP